MNETLYLIITGTLSAISAWIIISAMKYTYKFAKDLTTTISDVKQIKKEIECLKLKVNNLEENKR